jgi:hypothetical protein
MNNINLDINTYSIKELENLLKLKSDSDYTTEDVFNAKTSIVDNVIKSNISQLKKEELLIFLDNINNRLSNNLLKIDKSKFNDVRQFDGNHFIIKNENNKYTSTLENNKQVNKSIIKRTYTIDSLFRQNYNSETNESHNYIINLPEIITKAITMSISSVEIPLSYHNISEELNNNIFKIIVINNTTSKIDFSTNIILTTGLYEARFINDLKTGQDIVSEVQNQINTILSDLCGNSLITPLANDISFATDLVNCLKYSVDSRSGFSAFEYNDASSTLLDLNNFSIKIDFDVNNNNTTNTICKQNEIFQKLGWQLGFREKSILLNEDNDVYKVTNTRALIISRGVCHINYPRYIYIAIDDFQSSSRNYFSIAAESIIAPNIVGRINILSLLEEKTAFKQAAAPGDFLYTQKHVREYFGPTDINKLKISLLDEYGRPFPINNMDWSFIISFECFYN